MSIEQRWQDLANLLSIPAPGDTSTIPPHHPFTHHHPAFHNYNHPHGPGVGYGHDSARNVLLHNATLNPPIGEINSTGSYSNIGLFVVFVLFVRGLILYFCRRYEFGFCCRNLDESNEQHGTDGRTELRFTFQNRYTTRHVILLCKYRLIF